MPRCIPSLTCLLLVVVLAPFGFAERRTWTDASGQFTVQAELVSQDGAKARLRLANGQIIEVTVAKLGPADQTYLRQRQTAAERGDGAEVAGKLADAALAIYTFDDDHADGAADTASDLSSHAADGQIHGAVRVGGIAGQALKFDGRDDHVKIPKLIELLRQDLSALSVSMWIRQPAAKVCFGFDAGHYGESVSLQFNTNHARFLIPTKAGGQPLAFDQPTDDRWHHYALIWDGKSQQVYLDRRHVAEAKTTSPGILNHASLRGRAEVRLGSQTKPDRQNERYFSGEIDEVAFFNRPLEVHEIDFLYQQGDAHENLASLAPAAAAPQRSVATAVKEVTLEIGPLSSVQAHAPEKHVDGVAFSPDGTYLATASQDGAVKVWSLKEQELVAERSDLQGRGVDVTFLGSNDVLAYSTQAPSAVHRWNWREDKLTKLKLLGDSQWLDYCPATDQLVSPYKRIVSRWNAAGAPQHAFVLPENGQGCDLTADGQQIGLVLGTLGGGYRAGLLDVASGKLSLDVATSTEIFYDVAVSDDGRYVAAAHAEDRIAVIDATSKRKTALPGHDDGAYALRFLPHSHVLASAGWLDSHVRFWDVAAGKPIGQIKVPDVFALRSLAVSPDGRWLAVGDDDGMLCWWPIQP